MVEFPICPIRSQVAQFVEQRVEFASTADTDLTYHPTTLCKLLFVLLRRTFPVARF